jgi:diguanylate cyclase
MPINSQDMAFAQQTAAKALEQMARNDVPPTPENYAVWYAYCAGTNPGLSRSLEILISNKTPFTPERNAEIYEQFFEVQAYGMAMDTAGEQLETAIGQIQNLLDRADADTRAYGRRMSTLSGGLEDETQTMHQIRSTVRAMVQETRAILAKNQKLEERLQRSSAEVQTLRQDLEVVRRDALTDSLTGVPNRKMFDQRLREATATAMELGEPLSLMLLDIDHFKQFNDRYGHDVGDEVLKLVAQHLFEHLKGKDMPARFGGEEFAVILPNTRLTDAVTLANHIRHDLGVRPIMQRISQRVYDKVTVSAGVAQYRYGEPLDRFIRRSDHALYAAKRGGRNCVYSEMEIDDPDSVIAATRVSPRGMS